MKKLLLLFIPIILLGIGCSNQNISLNKKALPTQPNSQKLTAPSVIDGLKGVISSQGHPVTSYQDGFSATPSVWWKVTDHMAIIVDPAVGFDFVAGSGNESPEPKDMLKNSNVKNAMDAIDSYFVSRGLILQADQSTDAHPNIQASTFTRAYADPANEVRCRVIVSDFNGGEGETAPFVLTAAVACVDATAYQAAYDAQSPFFASSEPYLSKVQGFTALNPNGGQLCKNDPDLKTIETMGISEASVGYYYVKQMNGIWTNASMSGYQANQHCGR